MLKEEKFLWIWMSVSVCQGYTNSPATHDNGDLDDDSTSIESTTASDGLILGTMIGHSILLDGQEFLICLNIVIITYAVITTL